MSVDTTYSELRGNLASYLSQVADDREVVIVRRRDQKDVALIPAEELAGLIETAHLLRSPANAERLLESLRELDRGKGKTMSAENLRRAVGLKTAGSHEAK